jgi:HK97 family phage portal protein
MRERIFGSSEERTLTKENIPPVMLSSAPAGSVTPTNALCVGDAYACVRVLADAAASIPLIPYRRTQGGRTRMDDGTLPNLLRRPSPAMTQGNLIGQIVAHLNLWGNAYVGKFRSQGEVAQLALLAPDRVSVEIKGGVPVYTLTGIDGKQSTHGSDDIVHVKALSTDGVVGLSPVRQARTVLGLSDQLAQHAATFFENNAIPQGVLKLQRFGDADTQVEELRDAFEEKHKGTENAHRIAVVSGEVDFMPTTMPLDDAQFLEQRKLSAVEVARIFRVPPWMVAADSGESLTYSNTESQALQFVTYSLRPWLVCIEQAISADADLATGNAYCEFLLDALLRADSATRADVYTKALDPITGWMNREEVRERENLDPEPSSPPTLDSELAAMTSGEESDG